MDYEKFFNLYPSLAPHKESLFLLGEDPDAYQEDLQVAAYDLNREPDARDEEKPDTQSDFS